MARTSKSKKAQRAKKEWIVRIVLSLVLIAALLISLIWSSEINRAFNLTTQSQEAYTGDSRDSVVNGNGAVVTGLGNNLNIHFVDVGQGDSCIIELPDHKKMIIDGGDSSAEKDLLQYIDDNIFESDGSKIESFDYAVLTHSDADHCGSLDNVLENYPAEVFYRPNILCGYSGFSDPAANEIKSKGKFNNHDTRTYSRVLEAGYNQNKTNGIDTTVHITDANDDKTSVIAPDLPITDENYYEITFFAPTKTYYADVNDYSPVIMLEYQGQRMVVSGDAEKKAEESFVADATAKNGKFEVFDEMFTVNIIKLGHHGSSTSNSKAFLETLTTPDTTDDVIIIISCALVNKYKHPHVEVLQRLKAMGFKDENILSTAHNGSLGLAIKGELEQNEPVYRLYVGADMVRFEKPAVELGFVELAWKEIVFTLIILIVLLVLIVPLIHKIKKGKYRRAAMSAVNDVVQKSTASTAARASARRKNSSTKKK